MAFLAHSEIEKLAADGMLISKGFFRDNLRQASYDLRLGEEVYIVGKDAPDLLTDGSPYVSLPPGQFAILTCHEEIKIPPTHMAFIAVRTTFKFQGLVNISGFHVDPTYEGKLLFAVQNVGPSDIRLKFRESTFSIFFAELKGEIVRPRSKEETKFGPHLKGIRLQDVQVLGGSSITISRLQKEIEQLRRIVLVYGPIVVAALIALIVNLIKIWGSHS